MLDQVVNYPIIIPTLLLFYSMFCLQIPEGLETFQINLTSATGGAVIGQTSMASVLINKNDDAIYFVGKKYSKH